MILQGNAEKRSSEQGVPLCWTKHQLAEPRFAVDRGCLQETLHCKASGGGHDSTSVSQSIVQEPLIVCDIKDYFQKNPLKSTYFGIRKQKGLK